MVTNKLSLCKKTQRLEKPMERKMYFKLQTSISLSVSKPLTERMKMQEGGNVKPLLNTSCTQEPLMGAICQTVIGV
jgi:hypothetical protein